MSKEPAAQEKATSPSVQRKVKTIKRVVFWTTLVNILIFIAVVAIAYSLIK